MVVKLKFKSVFNKERVEFIEVEKPCLAAALMDQKLLANLIIENQKRDEYLVEIKGIE